MRYIVSRTSSSIDASPECDGEVQVTTTLYRDQRTFKTIDDWKKKFPEDFEMPIVECGEMGGGTYRIIKQCDVVWVVEVPDLIAFVKKYGRCVLSLNAGKYPELDDLMELEIYDDYRE